MLLALRGPHQRVTTWPASRDIPRSDAMNFGRFNMSRKHILRNFYNLVYIRAFLASTKSIYYAAGTRYMLNLNFCVT